MQFNDNGYKTFTAGAAIAPGMRVKMSGAKVILAGASDASIGSATNRSFADGDLITIKLKSCPGTHPAVASAAIAAGAALFAAANGKVAGTGTVSEGVAFNAASADGDIIERLA